MTTPDPSETKPTSAELDALNDLPEREFVNGWKAIVGEPPAIMLDSRADMVRVLVESVPVAMPDPAETLGVSDSSQNKVQKP